MLIVADLSKYPWTMAHAKSVLLDPIYHCVLSTTEVKIYSLSLSFIFLILFVPFCWMKDWTKSAWPQVRVWNKKSDREQWRKGKNGREGKTGCCVKRIETMLQLCCIWAKDEHFTHQLCASFFLFSALFCTFFHYLLEGSFCRLIRPDIS